MVAVRSGRVVPGRRPGARNGSVLAKPASRQEKNCPQRRSRCPFHLTPNPYSMYRFNRIARFTL